MAPRIPRMTLVGLGFAGGGAMVAGDLRRLGRDPALRPETRGAGSRPSLRVPKGSRRKRARTTQRGRGQSSPLGTCYASGRVTTRERPRRGGHDTGVREGGKGRAGAGRKQGEGNPMASPYKRRRP